MGCGGSRLGGASAARANESGVLPIPAGIRPLLRRRLEEIKKRSHAGVLKGSHSLSKKQLLRHGSSEDGEETEENDGSLKPTSKVAPTPDHHHVEEKKEVIYEKILSRDDVKDKEEDIVKKQEDNNHHQVINVKKECDDDNDEGRMSNFDERMICPSSPSFKVYCINVNSDDDDDDDDEVKDGEDTRKSTETERVIIIEPKKEEENTVKIEKRERKGKRFGIALPRKYLANVTAPCYASGGGCMGNIHSPNVQEKSKH